MKRGFGGWGLHAWEEGQELKLKSDSQEEHALWESKDEEGGESLSLMRSTCIFWGGQGWEVLLISEINMLEGMVGSPYD